MSVNHACGKARAASAVLLLLLLLLPSLALASSREAARLRDARSVLQETLAAKDAGVPRQLLEKCHCIAVFPGVVKGALGWGGRFGRGVISCRGEGRQWSAPSFLTLSGGSVGLQIGVEKADVVLFLMSGRGARSFVGSEFTLGAKGGLAAGPVGRTAEGATDIRLDAEIYSYARARGLFAGVSLEGARVNSDRKAIAGFYGMRIPPEDLLFGSGRPKLPAAAAEFVRALP